LDKLDKENSKNIIKNQNLQSVSIREFSENNSDKKIIEFLAIE